MRRLSRLILAVPLALVLSGCVFVPAAQLSTDPTDKPTESETVEAETQIEATETPTPSPKPTSSPKPTQTPEPSEDPSPDLAQFTEIDERGLALIAKDPDAHVGKNLIVYGEVTQYDSFTGKCSMRLSLAHTVMEWTYDYEHNTIASSGNGRSDCPELDPIVQDDIVKIWLTVTGSYSYDTTIGGTATAIAGQAWKVELL